MFGFLEELVTKETLEEFLRTLQLEGAIRFDISLGRVQVKDDSFNLPIKINNIHFIKEK